MQFHGSMKKHKGCCFPLALVLLFLECQHRVELVCGNLVERDPDAQLQRGPEIEGTPEQKPGLGILRRIELVQRAVVAAASVVRCIRAQLRVTELLAPQRPVDQESQGGLLRPLPAYEFGSAPSWKAASSASMAAFTETAWWMIGDSPT